MTHARLSTFDRTHSHSIRAFPSQNTACKSVLVCFALLAGGCASEANMANTPDDPIIVLRSARIAEAPLPDPRPWVSLSPEARDAAEVDAINSILERVPAAHRAKASALLQDRTLRGPWSMSSVDPVIAGLLSTIISIRAAGETAESEALALANTSTDPTRQRIVHVMVALVDSMSTPEVRATLIRRSGDKGKPLVLLPKDTFTPSDLAFALALAVRSADASADAAEGDQVRQFRRGEEPGEEPSPSPDLQAKYDWLRGAPIVNLPGIGMARVVEFATTVRQRRPTG